jgi:hypothetical protein
MRKLLVVALVLVPVAALALGRAPVSKWDDGSVAINGNYPVEVPRSQFDTVRIDSMVAYIRYLFEMKQAVILPEGDDYWFFFAYNDNHSHVRTKIFTETDVMNEPAWNVTDVYEWTGAGDLRYICPTAYWDGAGWYPEMVCNTYDGATPAVENYHFVDEGYINVGLWTPPIDVGGPNYHYYLPLIEAGTDNMIYMDGQARVEANDSHVFKSYDGFTGDIFDPPGEVIVGPDDVWWGQGYENSQLIYRDGLLVVTAGAYRTNAYTDPTNPQLIVYKCSTDDGNTWSDDVWLDQAVVPDMPGSIPGMQGYYSNQFLDCVIDADGDLHFITQVVDSAYYGNESYCHGLFDVHQDDGVWTASLITDGVYYVNADSTWDPRALTGTVYNYIHGPTLAEQPNGYLSAAWSDLGYLNPADSTLWFDIWYSWSVDGNTWHNPVKVTYTTDADESFPRLIPTTTDDYAYVLTTYGFADGPMDMILVPPMITAADDPMVSRPGVASLSAKPNPFSDDVSVSFSLASPGMVEASVYNAKGELVETMVRGSMPAGNHSLVWNAGDAPAGVYFARVNAGEETASARMVLVK